MAHATPGPVEELEAPAAARAHVRLVSAIEADSGVAAAVAARHPSVWRGTPARTDSTVRKLRPMPSADPLPKPPVIEPRLRSTGGYNGNGYGTGTGNGKGNGNGNGVTVRTFAGDDAAFRAWMEAHPQGFVLNHPHATRVTTLTLHRAGCPALSPRTDDAPRRATASPKVCAPSAGALKAWSRAHEGCDPTPCRRCRP